MKKFYLILSIWVTALFGYAQEIEITIQDNQKLPLTGATVQLVHLVDSSTLNGVADINGVVRFKAVSTGLYALEIRFIGFETLSKSLTIKSGVNRFSFRLEPDNLTLGEVTVKARKPLIRQEEDKTIIDPEPLANTSTNTLEILEKTPGVFVDQDGYIYLTSATPAQVFINGREQRMSAEDMATILRSLPPESIQQIEILRTPSSKYDAASTGGIVNVVLKKGIRLGRTGSISAGMNQGFYGNQFAGFSLNDSDDKTTYYLRVNYNHNNARQTLESTRFFPGDSLLNQVSATSAPRNSGFAGMGISRAMNQRIELSYDARINVSSGFSNAASGNQMVTSTGNLLADNINFTGNDNQSVNIQQEIGFRYKPDTIGSDWDTRFSYNFNNRKNDQFYLSDFLLPGPFAIQGDGIIDQGRHFLNFQSDLTLKLRNSLRVETGIKATRLSYRSSSDYFITLNGNRNPDLLRTNAFNYTESINAAYLQASRNLPWNLILKAGARIEHTYMKGEQTVPGDTSFLINRVDLFPYVFLSRTLFAIAGFDLRGYMIYRRTIQRPGYNSLNPYINYLDQYLYETGNPALKPQFTDNVEFNISFDDTPIFAIGRNMTTDIFSDVVYQDPQLNNVAVRTYDNVGTNRETYFRLIGAIPPGGVYFFVVGTQFNLNEYQGLYEGVPLSFSRGSWRFFTFHMLNLGPDTRLTMNGFYTTNGQNNFYTLDAFGQLNFGLSRSFFNKKLKVTLSANDVLRTMEVGFQLNQGSLNTEGFRYSDNQRYGINVRYAFGLKKQEERESFIPEGLE
jgi:outer membrane receptor protein involved in Fe transport